MRILIVNDSAAPVGGAELMTRALREGLRARGHDARLFASSAGASHADHGGAEYSCYGTTGGMRTLVRTVNPSAWLHLGRVLKEFRPDVVHVRMFLTQLSPLILPQLRRAGCPTLYHAVWYESICPTGHKLLPDGSPCRVRAGGACYKAGCLSPQAWVPLMAQLGLYRRWRDAFDLVVANSQAVRAQLLENGIGPVEVVHNGVPVRSARPPLAADATPTVAFAGRLSREKGADVLLAAFARVVRQLPAARLLVAGDGPDRGALECAARGQGLAQRVSFYGHVAREDLDGLFAGAWVQAVPSRWAEPFGLVAPEAMMRGTAVVATRGGGLAEIVRDGTTGLLVPPGDEVALSDALLRVLRDRELAEQMGRDGREVALEHFGQERFVDRFLELYQSLVRAGRRA